MSDNLVHSLKKLLVIFPNACIKAGSYNDDIALKVSILDREKIEIYTLSRRIIGTYDKTTGTIKRSFTRQEFSGDKNLPIPPDYIKIADILYLFKPIKRQIKVMGRENQPRQYPE